MSRLLKQALMAVIGLALSAMAAAGPIAVFVGYADGLRGGGFFPSPWSGDPGVVFQGAAPAFDAGAIRIDNTSGASLTVDSVSVNINGSIFAIWLFPVTLAAGERLILTETFHYNFDTSDVSVFPGASLATPATGCSPYCPIVTIGFNGGAATPFNDSGHVLDTSGFDFANVGNESFAWRLIGTVGGQAGIPEPSTLLLLGIAMAGLGFWRRKSV